jgi:hypothetical protein
LNKNLSVCGYFITFAPTYLHNFSRCRREMLAVFALYVCMCACEKMKNRVIFPYVRYYKIPNDAV